MVMVMVMIKVMFIAMYNNNNNDNNNNNNKIKKIKTVGASKWGNLKKSLNTNNKNNQIFLIVKMIMIWGS